MTVTDKPIESWTERRGERTWRIERLASGELYATDIMSPTGYRERVYERGVGTQAWEVISHREMVADFERRMTCRDIIERSK